MHTTDYVNSAAILPSTNAYHHIYVCTYTIVRLLYVRMYERTY